MKVIAAEFVTSAAAGGSKTGVPRDGLGQVAMTGRSNVGKSTLINALCKRPLARTSAAAGKTRLANVFRLTVEGGPRRGSGQDPRPGSGQGGAGRWEMYLVDLPGYGYARGGGDSAKELQAVAEAYMTSGPDLVFLLVDSRHPGLASDVQAYKWLTTLGIVPTIIATKIDKLTRAERTKNLRQLEDVFGTAAVPVAAERGEGLDELWTRIARTVRGTKDRR